MKKIIILTVALAFIVSAFALESDPSDVVGYVKYECVTTESTDDNFIALPLEAGYGDAEDLGVDIGSCDVVGYFDAANQGWIIASDVGFPVGWVGVFDVQPYGVYMVNVTADTDFYVVGSLVDPEPTYSLITTEGTDDNAIMVPLSCYAFVDAEDLGVDIGSCDVVGYFDAANQGWIIASDVGFPVGWVGVFDIEIGQPLMVNVTADVPSWP